MKFMLLLLILISSVSFAEVYKWVDENGNTQFSQFPPKDVDIDSETLTITPQNSPSVEISEKQLIGNWHCSSSDGHTFDMKINDDRTLSMSLTGKIKGEMSGSWSLKGVKMKNTLSGYLDKNTQRKYIKSTSSYENFIFVSSDSLKSIDRLGNTTKYKRF